MSAAALLTTVVRALHDASIPFMVVGSNAASVHGLERSTFDIDVVIDPSAAALRRFIDDVSGQGLYVPHSAVEALRARDQFNVIASGTGWKIDLIIRKERPFSRVEFGRRVAAQLFELDVFVASAEDTVLAKLEWAALGGSQRQLEDVRSILDRRQLDDSYLDRWATELGVRGALDQLRREIDDPNPRPHGTSQ